jgi:hypothetical protein
LKESTSYKKHRIHTKQLPSGLWITSIVNFGKRKMVNTDSLTAAVSRIPGGYNSEQEAIQAAKRYIDQEEEQAH